MAVKSVSATPNSKSGCTNARCTRTTREWGGAPARCTRGARVSRESLGSGISVVFAGMYDGQPEATCGILAA